MPEMIPSQTPAEFSRSLALLESLARSASTESSFLKVMGQAKAAGLSYREALEAVIREANGGAD
ncbi:MAG: hypothetical protein ACRYGF_06630 [Janthinobacterium lividum]